MQQVTVDLRYIALFAPRVRVRGAAVLHRGVDRREAVPLVARRPHGNSSARVLRVRVPRSSGTYRLVVTENGQSATAVVRVHG